MSCYLCLITDVGMFSGIRYLLDAYYYYYYYFYFILFIYFFAWGCHYLLFMFIKHISWL